MNEIVATREGLDIANVRTLQRDSEDMVAQDENDPVVINNLQESNNIDEFQMIEDTSIDSEDDAFNTLDENENSVIENLVIESKSCLISSDGLGSERNSVASLQHLELLKIQAMIGTRSAFLEERYTSTQQNQRLGVQLDDNENDFVSEQDKPAPVILLNGIPDIPIRELANMETVVESSIITSTPTTINVPVPVHPGDDIPLNEFTENKRILLHSFPELFLLGKGIPSNGTVSDSWTDHLNRQYTGKFASDKEFQFLIFNQRQRHAAAKVVASKVKNNQQAMEKVATKINSLEFVEKLEKAIENSKSKEAKEILKEFNPLLRGMGKCIPHTAAERANVITNMYALMMRYGLCSSFLTFAPDDTNEIMTLRMCYGLTTNNTFPATDELSYENNKISFKEVKFIILFNIINLR